PGARRDSGTRCPTPASSSTRRAADSAARPPTSRSTPRRSSASAAASTRSSRGGPRALVTVPRRGAWVAAAGGLLALSPAMVPRPGAAPPPAKGTHAGEDMTDREDRRRHTRCSFCGKGQEQVRKLVAGPGVYICDQCIDLCQEVLEEDNRSSSQKRVKSGM